MQFDRPRDRGHVHPKVFQTHTVHYTIVSKSRLEAMDSPDRKCPYDQNHTVLSCVSGNIKTQLVPCLSVVSFDERNGLEGAQQLPGFRPLIQFSFQLLGLGLGLSFRLTTSRKKEREIPDQQRLFRPTKTQLLFPDSMWDGWWLSLFLKQRT